MLFVIDFLILGNIIPSWAEITFGFGGLFILLYYIQYRSLNPLIWYLLQYGHNVYIKETYIRSYIGTTKKIHIWIDDTYNFKNVRIYYLGNNYYFLFKTDAMLFKLTWA